MLFEDLDVASGVSHSLANAQPLANSPVRSSCMGVLGLSSNRTATNYPALPAAPRFTPHPQSAPRATAHCRGPRSTGLAPSAPPTRGHGRAGPAQPGTPAGPAPPARWRRRLARGRPPNAVSAERRGAGRGRGARTHGAWAVAPCPRDIQHGLLVSWSGGGRPADGHHLLCTRNSKAHGARARQSHPLHGALALMYTPRHVQSKPLPCYG